ncbi:rCG59565 [Rattus norvegicus]|uniref:RCG59565 n=1 Tax=Rattus norvegicus TaxID=10116 RepID=A6HR49_RAT|nr:rCG59565 [Rattus norvegicus]
MEMSGKTASLRRQILAEENITEGKSRVLFM